MNPLQKKGLAMNPALPALSSLPLPPSENALALASALLSLVPEALLICDREQRIIFANDQVQSMFGYAPEELAGMPLQTILPEWERERQHASIALWLEKPASLPPELSRHQNGRRKDGREFPMGLRLELADAAPARLLVAIRDLSHELVMLDALRESERRFRSIFEETHEAVMLLDQRMFLDCNRRTLELFGFQRKEDFLRLHPAQVSPPVQADGRDSFVEAQERIRTAFGRGHCRFEWLHQRTNGEVFPAEVLLSAFDYDGRRILQATVQDISERKKAAAALSESQEHLQIIFEHSPEALLLLDDHSILDCNRRALELFGLGDKPALLASHFELLAPPTQADGRPSVTVFQEHLRKAVGQGESRFHWTCRQSNGSDIPALAVLTAFPHSGHHLFQMAIHGHRQRQADIDLQNCENCLLALSHDSFDAVIFLEGLKIVGANPMAQSLFSGADDLLCQEISQLAPAEGKVSNGPGYMEWLLAVARDGHGDLLWRYQKADGTSILAETHASAVGVRDGMQRLQLTIHPVLLE